MATRPLSALPPLVAVAALVVGDALWTAHVERGAPLDWRELLELAGAIVFVVFGLVLIARHVADLLEQRRRGEGRTVSGGVRSIPVEHRGVPPAELRADPSAVHWLRCEQCEKYVEIGGLAGAPVYAHERDAHAAHARASHGGPYRTPVASPRFARLTTTVLAAMAESHRAAFEHRIGTIIGEGYSLREDRAHEIIAGETYVLVDFAAPPSPCTLVLRKTDVEELAAGTPIIEPDRRPIQRPMRPDGIGP